ncbi:unnamed product [Ostreococcus tauri]|uniref:Unnamed product n=1 Tax=Ostreococcus tauri TaxID=70448 RepID=Q01EI9_OSTTA|nr:unnamed product [Ostreococcus tauri]CAL52264.1 unnamed product [Ostreococcus tauri]|eukprot:XP_003074993.1 unnamed product [Ostreococcus tauri]
MMLVTDFVKDNAVKIRSADVAFLPGGVTSDAAMARAELGVNNAKRAVEDAERKRQDKIRKEEDLLCQAIQDAPAILARIESLNDLRACTRAQLITLHRSVLRLHPRWQLKKADLIAALTLEISKEIESRNQHAEPHAELPGVPVPAPINAIDAEMLKIAHIEPMTETQTSLEPMPMGWKDGV